ncbi:MAG TPA: inorganic phosphate transporter [Rhodanobacteraceae bacterium]|nr:inorganic phosphate transporter [Rhodanobacteraceae bacterium]
MTLTLVMTVVVIALVFEYINGFHDTANSIATVVATKVLSPGQAVLLAAVTNFIGALLGTAVARTISTGLIDAGVVTITPQLLICALLGAILWDLMTWWWGLPTSSSHALVGGLCGAALAAAHNDWNSLIWWQGGVHWWQGRGLLPKVILPMVISPLAGFLLGFLIMGFFFAMLSLLGDRGPLKHHVRPRTVNFFFGKMQMLSASAMGISHGLNDAQKTMGIIALALAGATAAGSFDLLPAWLDFLRIPELVDHQFTIPVWIKATCALVMAAGTMAGGWRIIRTLGHKMVKLHPINGVAADTASTSVIITASVLGIPVSTTHNVSSAIMGVGAAKRFNAIRWTVVERMVWAWILTLPITAALAWCLLRFLQLLNLGG